MKDVNHNVMGMDIMTVVAMIFILVALVKTQTTVQQVLTNFDSVNAEKQSDPTAQNPEETARVYFEFDSQTQQTHIRFEGEEKGASEGQQLTYDALIQSLQRESPSVITIFSEKKVPVEQYARLLMDAKRMHIRIQLGATLHD